MTISNMYGTAVEKIYYFYNYGLTSIVTLGIIIHRHAI